MAAIITPTEQRQPATEADEASAFRNLIVYSGLYRLEPPDRFVTTVDVAWFQPWTGSQQARRFALHDDTLEIVRDPHRLSLAPMRSPSPCCRGSAKAPRARSAETIGSRGTIEAIALRLNRACSYGSLPFASSIINSTRVKARKPAGSHIACTPHTRVANAPITAPTTKMTVRRSTDPEFPMGICLTLKKSGVAGLDEAHQQHGEPQSGRGRYHCSAASSRSIRRANDRSRQAITSRVITR
jgi:hypothetical protein